MKKVISLVLAICLLVMPMGVSAENEAEVLYFEGEFMSQGGIPTAYDNIPSFSTFYISDIDLAKAYIEEELFKLTPEIDLSRFSLTCLEVQDIYQMLANSNAELFFLDRSYEIIPYYYDENMAASLIPTYVTTDKKQVDLWLKDYRNLRDGIVASVPTELDDLQKLLYVHDYIVSNVTYDTSYSIYDAYTMAKYRIGVCQAYTLLFSDIMDELYIYSTYAVSKAQNHIWNVVLLDGEFYHIDLTWDDPVTDLGNTYHKYFLISTDTMLSKAVTDVVDENGVLHKNVTREDWVSPELPDLTATSQIYESGYLWNGCDNAFLYVDGDFYMLDSSMTYPVLYKAGNDFINNSKTLVKNFKTWWSAPGGGRYYERSGFFNVGNMIFLNTADDIWGIEIENGEIKRVRCECLDLDYKYDIYGCRLSSSDNVGMIEFFIGELITTDEKSYISLSKSFIPIPQIITGNSGLAGQILDTREYVLRGTKPEYEKKLLDVNSDFVINVRDLVRIKRLAIGHH